MQLVNGGPHSTPFLVSKNYSWFSKNIPWRLRAGACSLLICRFIRWSLNNHTLDPNTAHWLLWLYTNHHFHHSTVYLRNNNIFYISPTFCPTIFLSHHLRNVRYKLLCTPKSPNVVKPCRDVNTLHNALYRFMTNDFGNINGEEIIKPYCETLL